MCMDCQLLDTVPVFLTFGLSGQRNPPAVTAAVTPFLGEHLAVWEPEDSCTHALAFGSGKWETQLDDDDSGPVSTGEYLMPDACVVSTVLATLLLFRWCSNHRN